MRPLSAHPPERLSDLLPRPAAAMESARRRALDFLSQNKYALVVPPLAEHWETLAVGGGDLSARTFQMTDTMSGRSLGIRADHTPQIARLDAASGETGIRRWAYCGPALRTRPDLPWRARESMQLGAELFGANDDEGDFEIARVAAGTLQAAGVPAPLADFGHAGIFNALTAELKQRAPEQWTALREAVCRRDAATLAEMAGENPDPASLLAQMAETSGPPDVAVPAARKLLSKDSSCVKMLDDLERCVRRMREAGWDAEIDLSELGGYAYHSGIVFAFYGENHIAARGGRYAIPNSERSESAAGFSMDLREITEHETRKTRETTETKETDETREATETRDTTETDETREATETRETDETRGTRKTRETGE